MLYVYSIIYAYALRLQYRICTLSYICICSTYMKSYMHMLYTYLVLDAYVLRIQYHTVTILYMHTRYVYNTIYVQYHICICATYTVSYMHSIIYAYALRIQYYICTVSYMHMRYVYSIIYAQYHLCICTTYTVCCTTIRCALEMNLTKLCCYLYMYDHLSLFVAFFSTFLFR